MKFLNRNHLKYIAVFAMLIDHFAHYFLSSAWGTPIYIAFRFIGRLTAPIMCYFLVEGFTHTTSKKKYFLRLLIFAIISQVAFDFAHGHSILNLDLSMIYTLLCCFTMLWTIEYFKNIFLKILSALIFIYLASFGDWGAYAPIWILGFYVFRGNLHLQILPYLIVSLYIIITSVGKHIATPIMMSGVLLFIPLIYLYNGKGGKKNAFNKWFFYIIYPLHLFLIGIIKIAATL